MPEPLPAHVAHTKLGAPASASVSLQEQVSAILPAPVIAPRPAPPALMVATPPEVVASPPASPSRYAAPKAAHGGATDASRIPTRDYDMAVGPRFTVATGGVDMGQYLALSRQYLRYQ